MPVVRLLDHPIVTPESSPSILENINGPSVIRVPEWVSNPLGKYYLYFAHHQGKFIRLAYADDLLGPWRIFEPGVLPLETTPFNSHVASPDVHVDEENRRIVMYYHGCGQRYGLRHGAGQLGCFSSSPDGLRFASASDSAGPPYMRVFQHGGWFYAFAGGIERRWWRSSDWDVPFESGVQLEIEGQEFPDSSVKPDGSHVSVFRMRHVAIRLRAGQMEVYICNVADCPERIRKTTVDLSQPWSEWRGTAFSEVLRPERVWEGIDEVLVPSTAGADHRPVNQLRDPYIFEEEGRTFLFYSVAGERGIALAEIVGE